MTKLPIYLRTRLLLKAAPEVSRGRLLRLVKKAGVTEGRLGRLQIVPALLEEKLPELYARVLEYVERTGDTKGEIK